MNAGVMVDEAADWARGLVEAETRGWGDQPAAMRRLAVRLGLPSWRVFWSLLYRRPKTIGAHIHAALRAAAAKQDEAARDLSDKSDELAAHLAQLEGDLAQLRAVLGG